MRPKPDRVQSIAAGMIIVPCGAFALFLAASGDRVQSGSIEETLLVCAAVIAAAGLVTAPMYLLLRGKRG